MKITALGEQYDGGRDVYVDQEGAHVVLAVDATSGSDKGSCMLTPGQARAISAELLRVARNADDWAEKEGQS